MPALVSNMVKYRNIILACFVIAAVAALFFVVAFVGSYGHSIVQSLFNSSVGSLHTWYSLNVVVNETFTGNLIDPLFVQSTGPSIKISEITFSARFSVPQPPAVTLNVSGQIVVINPCESQWNCKLSYVTAPLPSPHLAYVHLPDPNCTGVQECIADGKTPYCPNNQCDDLCMIIEQYGNAFSCSFHQNVQPLNQSLQKMYSCGQLPGTPYYVKFIPTVDQNNASGFVEFLYSDPNCILLKSETFYQNGCGGISGKYYYKPTVCSEACGQDGYGCQVATQFYTFGALNKLPPPYCPAVQSCSAAGKLASCVEINFPFPHLEGQCGYASGCGVDGYGCHLERFINFTTSPGVFVPTLQCAATAACIQNGNTPYCVNGTESIDSHQVQYGSCQNLCLVQHSYTNDLCDVLEEVSVSPAFDCQKQFGMDVWYRAIPVAGKDIALYDTFSDPGCNSPITRDVVPQDTCLKGYRYSFVDCSQVCSDGYGCNPPYAHDTNAYDICPETVACKQEGYLPWCAPVITTTGAVYYEGRCDDMCLQATVTNNTCAQPHAVLYTQSVSPQKCTNVGELYLIFTSYNGESIGLNIYSDRLCTIQVHRIFQVFPFCYGNVTFDANFCYDITISPQSNNCRTAKSVTRIRPPSPGPPIIKTYTGLLPFDSSPASLACKQAELEPVCTDSGSLICRDVCYGFSYGSGMFNYIGKINECLYDRAVDLWITLDYFQNNGYLVQYFDDPMCLKFNRSKVNIPGVRDSYGDTLELNDCTTFNQIYDSACIFIQTFPSDLGFVVPDYTNPKVLECVTSGRTPICQNFYYSDQTTSNQIGMTLGCVDMSVAINDYLGVPEGLNCSTTDVPQAIYVFDNPNCFHYNETYHTVVSGYQAGLQWILMYRWDRAPHATTSTQDICGSPLPKNPYVIYGNGECVENNRYQLYLGESQFIDGRFGCTDGYGCQRQWIVDGTSPITYVTGYMPNLNCPSSQSCQSNGNSVNCDASGNGQCGQLGVYTDWFSPRGLCPDEFAQFTATDYKSGYWLTGQCQGQANSFDYSTYGTLFQTSWISQIVMASSGNLLVVFHLFSDPGCINPSTVYFQPWPIGFRINVCYDNPRTSILQSSVFKYGEVDIICGDDESGCPQRNFLGNSHTGVCESGANCIPIPNCPTTQNCIGNARVPPLWWSISAFCYSALEVNQQSELGCIATGLYEEDEHTLSYYHNKTNKWINITKTDRVQYPPNYHQQLLSEMFMDFKDRYQSTISSSSGSESERQLQKKQVQCTIGAALIESQTSPHNLTIVNGLPIYVPQSDVLFAQVISITPGDGGYLDFDYESYEDPNWQGVVTNVGEGIYLVAQTTCNGVLVDGTFTYQFTYPQ